ncbi:MAG: hypothetical protein QOG42_889, partial [Solirubrobacteraceae bacterium]|nr:hypothetical protein [Solirubrobacteraceae bacterium]
GQREEAAEVRAARKRVEELLDKAAGAPAREIAGPLGSALRELARVLAPGGRLLVTVPQYGWLWGEHDVLAHHHRRYTRALLLARAADAGFEPERVTAFNTLLLPAIAAARFAQRARRHAQPASDLGRTPQGAVNGALERVLRAEAALIRRGRDLPAGVSLLAVLRRRAA